METSLPVRNVLISVFDKGGLEPLVAALKGQGARFFSTGGTATHLKGLGVEVTSIESVTQFPEMMDGRVKTLHPKVFGGILARRDAADDLTKAQEHGIPLFDLVVVNLYPFWDHLKDDAKTQAKYVDIGGPSMIRGAAKNHEAVTVLSDPDDYAPFLEEFSQAKGTRLAFRREMAARTFRRTSAYDALVAHTWSPGMPQSLPLAPQRPLRYGENPHQGAAWAGPEGLWQVHQGKELSYNNLLDAEAALRLVAEFSEPAVAVIKHNSPCGVAAGELPQLTLWQRAFAADDKSAFGGIVALNRPLEAEAAEAMSGIFLEVVLAPSITPGAKEVLAKKKNLRVLTWDKPAFAPFEVRAALGGWLIQQTDGPDAPPELKTVTRTPVDTALTRDLKFAWNVCKHVRSNAIVLAKGGVTVGMGGGQVSRVDAVRLALMKAPPEAVAGSVLASDAFFPFRDNIDLLKGTGIRAIIQPGGSLRDAEVIEACNELGIAMVFTGKRHFRH